MHTNYVFLLNADFAPLGMIHPARARELQDKKKAAVFRRYPYVLILKNQVNSVIKPCILKIDPGSKWTGFAIQMGDEIIFRMELEHRGEIIKSDLQKRAGFRRGRRSRNLRYRMERSGRRKKEGWLPPSLRHRLLTVETWIKRFMRYCPIITIEIEQVRFDTQKMNNPEISGVEYQQGELMGYEVRQYLLEKWGNECAYCGAKNVPLEVEHIKPKSKGGSDRVSNLTLACHCCNQKKGDNDVTEFVTDKTILNKILQNAKLPLKDTAAVNSTRFAIVETAKKLCNNVKCWTGGRTKYNRCKLGLEKSHSIDAACVGESGSNIKIKTLRALIVVCKGHGSRQARRVNKYGFPAVQKAKGIFKHATAGDIVRVILEEDRKNVSKGKYVTRVKTPTKKGVEVVIKGFRVRISLMENVNFIQRSDGYAYLF